MDRDPFVEVDAALGMGEDELRQRAEEDRQEREKAEWPEPDLSILTAHRAPAPPLPLDVFGPFWARWIGVTAAGKSCPPDFVALPLVSLAGAMLANVRRGSPWPDWCEAPIINTACIGKPSSGKSPGADAIRDLASRLEIEWNQDLEELERTYRTSRAEAEARREAWLREVKEAVAGKRAPPLEPEAAKIPEPPERRRLVIADTTVEQAARLAKANSRGLLLMRDELAGWLGSMDRYGGGEGGDRPFWLETYGGRPYTVDRVKGGCHVARLAIGITGGIQPDRLASMLLAGEDDGLSARFVYGWPERVPPARPNGCADHAAALTALRRLRDLPMGQENTEPAPVVLGFTPQAATVMDEWRREVFATEETAEGLFCSWVGKLPGMALRLAVVLEHLWWCADDVAVPPAAVSERAITAAVAFLSAYAVPMVRRTFGDAAWSRQERDAAALAKWLVSRAPLPQTINAREIRRSGTLSDKQAATCDAAMAELAEADWIRPAPGRDGGGKGRQRKDWEVNPKLQKAS